MMHSLLLVTALAGLVRPQLIELDKINSYDPVFVKAPLGVVTDTPPDVPDAPVEPITKRTATRRRRSAGLERRDGDCSPQPTGAGPVPSPDTAEAFLAFPTLAVRPQTLFYSVIMT